ncbi:MAG: hypothetical protein U0930_00970 [Pirellulales bacterium]
MNNFPVSSLIEGIPHSLAHLENVSASISWENYLSILQNVERILTPKQRYELFFNYSESAYLRSMLLSGGLWLSPIRFFVWATRGRGNMVERIFSCIRTRVVSESKREGVVEYSVIDGHATAPKILWDAFAASIEGTARVIGMKSFLQVSWVPVDRGARFTVQFPRR